MRLDFSFPRRVRLVYFGRIGLGILRNYVTEADVAIYENPRERLNVWVALRDRKSTRLNSSHVSESRMPSSA